MVENRGKKHGFSARSGAEKNANAKKKRSKKTKFFKSKRFERATCAKEKTAHICLEMAIAARQRRAFFGFLALIWPARRGRQMFKRQGFCRSWASLRRRRGRQAVFREQFLAHLGFHSGPARPPGSL